MDLITSQLNRPVKERLTSLADELGEKDILGLAMSEIRAYQTSLRATRAAMGELLAAQGVYDWVAEVGTSPERFSVSQ